jgi:hypothetical protein
MAKGNRLGDNLTDALIRLVQKVENTPEGGQFFSVTGRFEDVARPTTFRICTFTGAWSKNQDKTITFKHGGGGTVVATNLFANLSAPASTAHCAIHAEGTAWYLISAECE